MAVRVRQTYIQHQPELPEQQHEQVREHKPQPKKSAKFFTPGEKFLFIIFAVVVASFDIFIVHTQGEIQTVSMETQTI